MVWANTDATPQSRRQMLGHWSLDEITHQVADYGFRIIVSKIDVRQIIHALNARTKR